MKSIRQLTRLEAKKGGKIKSVSNDFIGFVEIYFRRKSYKKKFTEMKINIFEI
jgi:hypothetical protein